MGVEHWDKEENFVEEEEDRVSLRSLADRVSCPD